ncbi:hypothetical protein PU629_05590 [Pullulanibacillus sp. KACC 23026]|uniref:hypothetical protein n=1 Tax=Pullulanibacillus sp. KACC 23026 TaxID=3028315 RepID=UPI0023AFED55|nr:hypothetical protein [Pullulanibacillus sp. KACC 23026]WEG13839.1 hypothetical protein PU629_05590 [Pullulanibacillus sp. KACC 23026]
MSFLSPTFMIRELKIGTISEASCLNMGNNWPTNFESHKKLNQGFGSITGDQNKIENIRSLLSDPDFIDMLTLDEEKDIPDWLLELMQKKFEEETEGTVSN